MPAKHIYFIGIGGASLNGIAQVLQQRGFKVSGSDANSSPVTAALISQGITVHIGQRAANITPDIDEVIISSAVSGGPGAVEVEAARELKIPIHKRTVWWSRLMSDAKVAVAVAGTHGKTSTTAMLGVILAEAGLDPTVLVGGEVPDFNGTVRVGGTDCVVVEADEYDRAFYATRPTISIITNIDYDHPDTYPTVKNYTQAFRRFARLVYKRGGAVIACGDDGATRKALQNWHHRIYWYGQKNRLPGLKTTIPGEHMLLNAQAAAKAAHLIGVPFSTIKRALAKFKGVERRFTLIGEYKGMKVYDDFAHHPKEIEAVIKTAKTMTKKPVAVLFQPHQQIRTRKFAPEFARALALADEVRLLPIYTVLGREQEQPTDSDEITKHNPKLKELPFSGIPAWLDEIAPRTEILLSLGAGNISEEIRKIVHHD